MKEKVMKVFKKTKNHLFIIFAIIVTTSTLGLIFPDSSESIYSIFSWVFICYIMLGYFDIVFKLSSRREISSLNRRANTTKKSLYRWLGNVNWDDTSISQWLKEEEKDDVTSNLRAIKKAIKIKVGNDIYDYYLLKNYLEYHGKHNFMNSVRKTFGVAIIGGLAGALAKWGILDQVFKVLVEEQKNPAILELVELIIQVGVISLITLVIFLFIKNELTMEKRRIDLLISIVDTIIKEEEAKM